LGVATPIPGAIFTGNYLRIGINDGGTFGVGGPSDPGVGLQWAGDTPFVFPSTESLAIWWWGEGYNIAYKEYERFGWVDTVAYYQPGFGGWPPPAYTNIVPVSAKTIVDDEQKAIQQVEVMTADRKLKLTFTFTFLKDYPNVVLETRITNVSPYNLRDVVYKRIVDFDVCTGTWNDWASTSHEAFAWEDDPGPDGYIPEGTQGPVQLTVAGYQEDGYGGSCFTLGSKGDSLPTYVDLFAWDDQTTRKPWQVLQSFVPITGDYEAGIYYDIGDLGRLETRVVYTVYQANFPPWD